MMSHYLNKLFIIACLSLLAGCSTVGQLQPVDLVVSLADQAVYVRRGNDLIKTYAVSTSRYGAGETLDSGRTPRGLHHVAEKIGEGVQIGTVFIDRKPLPEEVKVIGTPPVTTRILWLAGDEPHNQNTKSRYIYLHGSPVESLLGTPASAGCVRLRATDVVELFDLVKEGTPVLIIEQPYLQFLGPPPSVG
jgi:lipoprotein-anchoring transpeptidase ErfK/SrfK